MHFKKLLSLAMIFSLGVSFSFASASPNGIEVGDLSEKSTDTKENIALKFMDNKLGMGEIGIKSLIKGEFKITQSYTDDLGLTTVRIQQYYNNYPIFGSDQIVNVNANGVVKSYVGSTLNLENLLPKKATLNEDAEDAIITALLQFDYIPELDQEPTSEIVIYPKDNAAYYAYKVELVFTDPTPGRWFFFIDAATGDILNQYNTIDAAVSPSSLNPANSVTGTGTDVLGATRTFTTNKHTDGLYYLADMTRGKGIVTYNAKNRTTLPGTFWSDKDNVYNASADRAAVSAQYLMGITYDYYKNKFNRNSFDGRGAQIKSSVHVGSAYNNAYWNGTQLAFGDGDGSKFIPLSGAIDVVAHELTHAVTTYSANLTYQNESGALNEAMSDIMGTAVEFYSNIKPDWLCGEDIAGPGLGRPALRSLENPAAYGAPDHYSKRYTGSDDNGGVHTNSSIINKAAYLIGNGGTHYGITVQGQGVEAMEKIFYRALTTYMTSSTNFAQGKAACVQAATDLYGATSPQVKAVKDAFTAVGIN